MKKSECLKLLISYIKLHKYSYLLFCSFGGVFALIFFLYHLPLEPILYAFALCIYLALIFWIINFIQYYKQHKLLTLLQTNITVSIEELPFPKGLIEEDYQALMTLLHDDKVQASSKADLARTNMTDYFTLWAHQIKTPIAAMHLLLQMEENEQNAELSMELFKIEQYVEMVLQYLRLDHTSSDFVLKR